MHAANNNKQQHEKNGERNLKKQNSRTFPFKNIHQKQKQTSEIVKFRITQLIIEWRNFFVKLSLGMVINI